MSNDESGARVRQFGLILVLFVAGSGVGAGVLAAGLGIGVDLAVFIYSPLVLLAMIAGLHRSREVDVHAA